MSEEDSIAQGEDPLIGTTIQDRYRIEKKLGQGGMGAVYLAEHMLIQKKVAIKCLHAGLASNADVVRRFHNEAVAATAIGHPNIVDVTDMGRFDDGTFFMALEFLPGRDWQDDLDQNPVQPLEQVAHIGMQICDALEAAATKGIVHRDLKPENIFLIERHGDKDFVKVLDFGISKFHDGIGGSTKTGELMGTPYYMAPEQVRGERNVTHVADIYALGVIFYQALTGSVPFDGNTLPELILKIATEPAPKLDTKLPDAPQQVVKLVDRMLRKDADERPQTFHEVADVLAEHISSSSRLSRNGAATTGFGETALGGSADEPPRGEPVPVKVSQQPTPFAARGPDTEAGGTPGLFGRTEVASDNLGAPAPGTSTTTPHSLPATERAPTTTTPGNASQNRLPLALVGVAAIAGAAWLFVRESPPAPAESATEPALSDNTARVQVSTLPPGAELYLDGQPISNPFDGQLEQDDESHELVAKREGFLDKKQKITLSAPQRVFMALTPQGPEKEAAPAEKQAPQPSPRLRPRKTAVPAKPAPTPAPAPVAAPVAAPAPAPVAAPAPAPAPKSDLKSIF